MNLILVFGVILNLSAISAMDTDGGDCHVLLQNTYRFIVIQNHTCEEVYKEIQKNKND